MVDIMDLARPQVIEVLDYEAVLGALILLSVSADAILMRRLNRMRVEWQIKRQQEKVTP